VILFVFLYISVLSDKIVNQTQIKDASVVIHYDMPNEQRLFAGRMWCCRANFYQLVHSREV